jgi:hypothetical protein
MLLSNLLGKLPSQKQDFIYGRTDISADMQLQYRTIRDDNYFPKSFYVTKDDTLLDDFGTLLRNGQGKGFLGNVQQFSGYLNGVRLTNLLTNIELFTTNMDAIRYTSTKRRN